MLPLKVPTTDFRQIGNADRTGGAINWEEGGEGGLQVHGNCSSRLIYKEVVEALSNYEKSNFWLFRNPAGGDSTGSNRIEKVCRRCRCSIPRRVLSHWIVYSEIVNFVLKINDGRCRGANFVICSASYG